VIFSEFPSADTCGVRLAHTLKLPHLTLHKGRLLSAADAAALVAAGVERIAGARLEDGEIDENAAAQCIATMLESELIVARAPYTGRCNLYARTPGLLLIDAKRIDQLNRVNEAITLATLASNALVGKNQRVATVKIIPFAVPPDSMAQWRTLVDAAPPLRIAPLRPRRAALIMSVASNTTERMLEMTVAATRARVETLGSTLALELRCAHEGAAVAQAIGEALAAGCDLLLVLGATISKDRGDVVPAAIVAAGGVIEHFGMPVEPGNMLLCARIDTVPVFNLPGCARSRAHNGLDILLQRLCAGLPLAPHDIMGLGVGGLIHAVDNDEAADGDAPREAPVETPPPRIAVLVLAAGRSTRMGAQNKLLCMVDGVPLVRRAVNAACASRACQVMVVTGHEAQRIEATLVDRPISIVRNPDYAEGMATSLRCGLRALPADIDGVVVMLADMPAIGAVDVDRLIAAFDPAQPAVLVPEHAGRRGNPVLWPRRHFGEMMAISGDTGARGLLEQYASEVRSLPFPSAAIFADVDTPASLENWVHT